MNGVNFLFFILYDIFSDDERMVGNGEFKFIGKLCFFGK